jgi:hypothetical protein
LLLLQLLLLQLLLHSGCRSQHGFVILQVVDELPLFVLGVVIDDVNSFPFRGACHSRDTCASAGQRAGG